MIIMDLQNLSNVLFFGVRPPMGDQSYRSIRIVIAAPFIRREGLVPDKVLYIVIVGKVPAHARTERVDGAGRGSGLVGRVVFAIVVIGKVLFRFFELEHKHGENEIYFRKVRVYIRGFFPVFIGSPEHVR